MKIDVWNEMQWEQVTKGIRRKIISGANLMVAQIDLCKGAVVPQHSHISEQISYILQGELQFVVDGKQLVLRAGEVLVIPANVPHEALALEDTVSLDMFSPIRQDWLDHTDDYFHRQDS